MEILYDFFIFSSDYSPPYRIFLNIYYTEKHWQGNVLFLWVIEIFFK